MPKTEEKNVAINAISRRFRHITVVNPGRDSGGNIHVCGKYGVDPCLSLLDFADISHTYSRLLLACLTASIPKLNPTTSIISNSQTKLDSVISTIY